MALLAFATITAGIIASISLTPKTPAPPAPNAEDFEAPKAENGTSVIEVFGTYTIKSPNTLWFGDISFVKVRTKSGK